MENKEIISLIKDRIDDEFRKHPDLDWSGIAAGKLHTQWSEYYEEINKGNMTKASKALLDMKAERDNALSGSKHLAEALETIAGSPENNAGWMNSVAKSALTSYRSSQEKQDISKEE